MPPPEPAEDAAPGPGARPSPLRRLWGVLPRGTGHVGAGVLAAGGLTYVFLILPARAMGPARYASFSAMWALTFLLVPACLAPLDQEVSRALAARRAAGEGTGPVVRHAAALAAWVAAGLAVLTLAAGPWLLGELLDGEVLLLVGLVVSYAGYAATALTKGVLGGTGAFGLYGGELTVEAVTRLVLGGALVAVGVHSPGPYGLAVGLAPLIAVAPFLSRVRAADTPGPPARRRELGLAVGQLFLGSLFQAALLNAPTLAVKVLAGPSEAALAGRFLAALVVARIPLYFSQAVQAALLPQLTRHAAAGEIPAFRRSLGRLVGLLGSVGAAAVVVAGLAGPWAVRVLYGPAYVLAGRDFAVLAAAGVLFLIAQTLVQGLIALNRHRMTVWTWSAGAVVFAAALALPLGAVARASLGFLAGSAAAAGAAAAALVAELRRRPAATP